MQRTCGHLVAIVILTLVFAVLDTVQGPSAWGRLNGFNLQPRLSVPFSGPIDANSVTSDTVFLVSLGSTLSDQGYMPPGNPSASCETCPSLNAAA